MRNAEWEDGFERLQEYLAEHGDALVPTAFKVDGYPLGKWVRTQRKHHAKGTLDPDRERRLQDLPGWVWDARSGCCPSLKMQTKASL